MFPSGARLEVTECRLMAKQEVFERLIQTARADSRQLGVTERTSNKYARDGSLKSSWNITTGWVTASIEGRYLIDGCIAVSKIELSGNPIQDLWLGLLSEFLRNSRGRFAAKIFEEKSSQSALKVLLVNGDIVFLPN